MENTRRLKVEERGRDFKEQRCCTLDNNNFKCTVQKQKLLNVFIFFFFLINIWVLNKQVFMLWLFVAWTFLYLFKPRPLFLRRCHLPVVVQTVSAFGNPWWTDHTCIHCHAEVQTVTRKTLSNSRMSVLWCLRAGWTRINRTIDCWGSSSSCCLLSWHITLNKW